MKQKTTNTKFDILRYANVLIILLPLLVYISALRLGFVYFDDDILILGNYEKISNLLNIGKAFRTDAFFANLSPYYRPLMNVSFMIDALTGGKSPAIYHLWNLIYHILACLSLFWLLQLLKINRTTSLAITLLFSIHPLMGHAILWLPARGDLLVTLFSILSVSHLIKFIDNKKPRNIIFHILFFALALFSKESGVFLPPLFLFFMILNKESLFRKQRIPLFISWMAVFVLWWYLRDLTIDHRPDNQRGIMSLFLNIQFLPESVARLIFPFALPVTPVFSTIITIMGLVFILTILFLIFKTKKTNNWVLVIFGSVWFLGFCLPNMFVRLSSANDSFEYLLHRIYLPSIGFIIMLLGFLPGSWLNMQSIKTRIVFVSLALAFLITDLMQQQKYKDAVSFWSSSISYAPDRAWFHYFLGRYYFKQNDFKTYEQKLLTADSIKSYPIFRYNLGMIYYTDRKDYNKAYVNFASAFNQGYSDDEAKTNFVLFCIESSCVLFKNNQIDSAISRCQEALNNDPTNSVAAYDMGLFLVNKGEKQKAASMWKTAIKHQPEMAAAYRSLCMYYIHDVKKTDSARYYAEKYKFYGGQGELLGPELK